MLTTLAAFLVPSAANATLFSVSTTADSDAGSLREAITQANDSPGADTIDFVGAGEGTISPLSELPASTGQLGIDGGNLVTLDGSSLSGTESGLRFGVGSSNSQVAGLTVQNFPGDGIDVTSGTGTAIENNTLSGNAGAGLSLAAGTTSASVIGNTIGVDSSGSVAQPNGASGILVNGAGHQIGSAASPNVVSGNGDWGIDVAGGTAANKHLIRSNQIGTDGTGAAALPNTSGGVLVEATAPGTTVGGSAAGQGNVLSGNTGPGVRVSASNATVAGNTIGLDTSRTVALGNGASGVEVQGAPSGVVIGGTVAGAGNVISGNGAHGVSLATTTTQVIGNRIGTDASGTSAVPNAQDGIYVTGANNRIGVTGVNSPAGNLISGNSGYGVEVDTGGNGAIVQANKIGTDATGSSALPNGVAPSGAGILAREAVTIGGTAAGTGNVISGNDGSGVILDGSDLTQSSTVRGNTIGLNAAGAAQLANAQDGIRIEPGPTGAETHATIGGSAAGAGNLISGNTGSGISSDGTGVSITGNDIGVAADGTTPAGNAGDGIALGPAAHNHVIGGATAADENVIAHQSGSGISDLSGTGGNQIAANSIFGNGVLPIDQLTNGLLDPNDTPDTSPQNSPSMTSALTNGSAATLRGNLSSAPSKSYTVRIFYAGGPTCDGTDMTNYLGAASVQTDGTGHAAFNVTLSQVLPTNRCVTAIATSPQGNSSELGAGVVSAAAGTVQVAPTSYSVLESDRKATIVVRRTGPTTQSMTFHYATIAGTAHAGSDYTSKSGTATIPAGASSANVVIPVVDDPPAEPRETFKVAIDSPVGAVLGTARTATVTIDDDAFGATTRVALVVARPLKATPAGVVKIGARNTNPFTVSGTLRVVEGTRAIGSRAASVAPGATQQVSVQLSSAAVAELKQKGQIKATLNLLVRDGDGNQRTVAQSVTIFRG